MYHREVKLFINCEEYYQLYVPETGVVYGDGQSSIGGGAMGSNRK
jgi:hypothetical protein